LYSVCRNHTQNLGQAQAFRDAANAGRRTASAATKHIYDASAQGLTHCGRHGVVASPLRAAGGIGEVARFLQGLPAADRLETQFQKKVRI
jgi:hypothetical protein